jgi:Uncharacterized conserved protein
MLDNPQFIADATLGKLAKWLRLLGYDAVVFPKEAGREMLRLAAPKEGLCLRKEGTCWSVSFPDAYTWLQTMILAIN